MRLFLLLSAKVARQSQGITFNSKFKVDKKINTDYADLAIMLGNTTR